MSHPVFIEIDKFDKWAQAQSGIPQDDWGGEWECNYDSWDHIYKEFKYFMTTVDPIHWSDKEKERLLYIIARDNEMGHLAAILNEQSLIALTKESIISGHRNDKWQLAVQLHRLTDKNLAITLLDTLVNDEEEYVNRMALIALAELQSGKIEFYAEVFWNRKNYDDMDEYQKMAVLHALRTVNSKQLGAYIKKAKQDGRKYLVNCAMEIENEKKHH